MRRAAVFRIVGFFFMGFSLTLLIPLFISLWYGDGEARHFLVSLVLILLSGVLFLFLGRGPRQELATRDGFLIVAIFWGGISTVASLPLILGAHLDFVDALFEAVSAFTTTGATVITGLDDLPRSVLFYRQQLQWFGGMGMIVLAVAVLPMVGIGGMQLYKAEAPGPLKEEKLTPRLAQTARVLWVVYLGITVANALAYWLAGMSPFDAVAHSLTTVSTGGFSTHDASLGWFHSPVIEAIAVVFMLMGGINFSIHFIALRSVDPLAYLRDVEVRTFLLFVLTITLLISLTLFLKGEYPTLSASLRNAVFEVVSVVTSTGFGTVDFSRWPDFLPVLLIFISFVGGCGGSTAGGIKVMRVMVLIQMGLREVRRLIHPNAVLPLRMGGRVLRDRVLEGVWGFFAAYVMAFVVLMLLMMHAGLDQVSAFSAIATSMNNLGPGLGRVASTFADVSDAGKMIAAFAMLLGRLEIFTILVLLTPEFWKR